VDAYGRTLAYLYLDDGEYEHLYNEELIRLGLARTTLSHADRREFGRLREEAEERGAGLWRLL
jgi:endonuclease YncB( thermonuclease family)